MDAKLNRILRDIAFQTWRISRLPPLLPDIVEALKIVPMYWTMRLFYTHGFTALKPALAGLDQNICFINTDNETLNLSCDWCSIINGTVETAKVNLQRNPQLWGEIDTGKLTVINRYLDFVLSARETKVTQRNAENFATGTFGAAHDAMLIFSMIYLKLEQIELRWCPYKRAIHYYRSADPRFIAAHDKKTVYEVGRILAQHETITCNNCPRVVRQAWHDTHDMHSIHTMQCKSHMSEFLQYILQHVPRSDN